MTTQFGIAKLGPVGGSLTTLPDMASFGVDPVRQGGTHVLLGGKAREDRVGVRRDFRLEWEGLEQAEYDSILNLFMTGGLMQFQYWGGTYSVIFGNMEPGVQDAAGYISCSLTLKESL